MFFSKFCDIEVAVIVMPAHVMMRLIFLLLQSDLYKTVVLMLMIYKIPESHW
jgi:hypothetical protein